MKTAELYIKEAYGHSHIETLVQLKDYISLYAIMQEYGNYLAESNLKESVKRKWINSPMSDKYKSIDQIALELISELPKL